MKISVFGQWMKSASSSYGPGISQHGNDQVFMEYSSVTMERVKL